MKKIFISILLTTIMFCLLFNSCQFESCNTPVDSNIRDTLTIRDTIYIQDDPIEDDFEENALLEWWMYEPEAVLSRLNIRNFENEEKDINLADVISFRIYQNKDKEFYFFVEYDAIDSVEIYFIGDHIPVAPSNGLEVQILGSVDGSSIITFEFLDMRSRNIHGSLWTTITQAWEHWGDLEWHLGSSTSDRLKWFMSSFDADKYIETIEIVSTEKESKTISADDILGIKIIQEAESHYLVIEYGQDSFQYQEQYLLGENLPFTPGAISQTLSYTGTVSNNIKITFKKQTASSYKGWVTSHWENVNQALELGW